MPGLVVPMGFSVAARGAASLVTLLKKAFKASSAGLAVDWLLQAAMFVLGSSDAQVSRLLDAQGAPRAAGFLRSLLPRILGLC